MKSPRSPNPPNVETSDNAADAEISAFLTATKGMSSADILKAMAALGKDSAWLAGELTRMYEDTDELYYKTKAMNMMLDLLKQKEGQRISVESDMSGVTDQNLERIETAVNNEITKLLERNADTTRQLAGPSEASAESDDPEASEGGAGS